MQRNLTVYVLIRNDLPSLNAGKAAAQVHHAGVQMVSQHHNHPLVKQYISDGKAAGAEHFNTTLTLGATEAQILKIMENVVHPNLLKGYIYDPTYPFFVDKEIAPLLAANKKVVRTGVVNGTTELFVRKELTCAWLLGDRNDDSFKNIFEGLNLY